jgi:hypothetical protein
MKKRLGYWDVRAVALALAVLVGGGAFVSGCAAKAVVTKAPTQTDTDAARAIAIRIADETRRAVAVSRIIRQTAQDLTAPNGPITKEQMDAVDKAAIRYGTSLNVGLDVLGRVTATPSLVNTAAMLAAAANDFIASIPATGSLKALLDTLRIILTITFQQGGIK